MPRRGLDHDQIVEAAAAIADREGLAAVTLGAIAQHVGVKPPSLYNHVDGLEAVLGALRVLAMRRLTEQMKSAAGHATGAEALLAMARSWRDFAKRHPGLYLATVRAPDSAEDEVAEATKALMAVVLVVLGELGLRGDEAIHAARSLRAMLHGFVLLEAGEGFGIPIRLDESFQWSLDAWLSGVRSGETER